MIASIPYMGSPLAASCVIFPFLRISLDWTDIECEMRGAEHLASDKSYVLVVNHQSSLDIIPMSHIWPNNCIVLMKRSLRYVPGFNVTAWLAGSVFVDRSNRERAIQSVTHVVDTIRSRRVKVWVFPEGTRNHETSSLLPFKKGAFHMAVQAGIPIVPCVISSYDPFYSHTKLYFRSGGKVIIQVLPPISSTHMAVDELMTTTRDRMLPVYDEISREAAQLYNDHQITATAN